MGESVNMRRRKSRRYKKNWERRNTGENVSLFQRAIMESLCLVKSHEITRMRASMYSAAAAARERERARESLMEDVEVQIYISFFFIRFAFSSYI